MPRLHTANDMNSKRSVMKRKCVRFDAEVTVRFVPSLLALHEKKKMKALYYNVRDYDNFNQQDTKLIRKMEATTNSLETSSKCCTRGLEGRTLQGRWCRSGILRTNCQLAVLEEQMVQRETGDYDPELIANVYHPFSIRAAQKARDLAKLDALFVVNTAKAEQVPRKSTTFLRRIPSFSLTAFRSSHIVMSAGRAA